MRRSWDELVAEGEQLKIMEDRVEAEAGNVRWLWGDLALEVAPMAGDGVNNGATEVLRRYADELDVSFESLRAYRNVADAWPAGIRIPAEPWGVHQLFMGRDDREEWIANPFDVREETRGPMDRWTYRAAQRFLGKKPSPHYEAPPRTASEKAERVADWLDDPEVAEMLELLLEGRGSNSSDRPKAPLTFDQRCAKWVRQTNKVLMDGSKIASEAESTDVRTGHVALALLIYEMFAERHIDAEIRSLLDDTEVA